LFDKTHQDGVT